MKRNECESDDNERICNLDCEVCQTKLTAKCLYCNLCDKLVCLNCLGITTKLFDVLTEKKTNSSAVLIVCKPCRNNAFKTIKKEINRKEESKKNESMEIKNMMEKLEHLSNTFEEKMDKLENFEQLSKSIKNAPSQIQDALKISYADVMKNTEKRHTLPNEDTIKGVVKQALTENKEEEDKKNKEETKGSTIIIYNCPESDLIDTMERKLDETNTVKEFIREGIKIRELEIQKINRIGRFNMEKKDKPRPLRINFTEKYSSAKVFKNIANLKNAEEKYKSFSIQRELSKEELLVLKEKLKEAKEKNTQNKDETIYYVVRGPPTKPEIRSIQAKKVKTAALVNEAVKQN